MKHKVMLNTRSFNWILLLLMFNPKVTLSQVGIGTTSPNASAKLQVDADPSSNAKGFLPPRVALQGTNDAQLSGGSTPRISSPATGLLIYNTATAGTSPNNVTPGYYYYSGSQWQRLNEQVEKSFVDGYFNETTNYPDQSGAFLDATDVVDINNDFSANTFTAPRTGLYTFTFVVTITTTSSFSAGYYLIVKMAPSDGQLPYSAIDNVGTNQTSTDKYLTVRGTHTYRLAAGTTVKFQMTHNSGATRTLYSVRSVGYNRFSITEN